MNTADTLRKAKALISDPKNWNKDGFFFKDDDPDTGCMCIYGAAMCATGKFIDWPSQEPYGKILEKCSHEINGMGVTDFNDHSDTTHDAVVAFLDRAIEVAELQT